MIKKKIGIIFSLKNPKSALVEVTRFKSHPLYGKKYRVSKKFLVQNKLPDLKEGDRVEIVETKPISKRKSWKIINRLDK